MRKNLIVLQEGSKDCGSAPSSVDKNIKKVYFLLKIGFSFESKYATIYLYRKYSDENVFRLF